MSRLSLLLIATLCVISVVANTHIIKESLTQVPTEWKQGARAASNDLLHITIAIKQRNVDQLEHLLSVVSDPKNSAYGHHLSYEQVNDLVAPSSKSIHAVMNWLSTHGVDISVATFTPNKDFVSLPMTITQAETLLHTQYHTYQHQHTDNEIIRTLSYKLPQDIATHVDFVGPTIRFPQIAHGKKLIHHTPVVHHKSATIRDAPNCDAFVVNPACIRQLYNIGAYASVSANNSVGCTGFLEQYISLSDLSTFFQSYDNSSIGRVPAIIGPNDQTQPGVEASLDIQYMMSTGAAVPATFFYTAGRQPGNAQNEPFLVWLQALASNPTPPWVISTSYGDNEPTVQLDYATRVNTEFMKAGVRGISLLYSSGDGGVSGGQSQACTTFVPTFPAGSPYVTAVGGTTYAFGGESAASFSSGGFTNYWAQPTWQKNAVTGYLTKFGTNLPDPSLYNATGRGFPDISALGTQFQVVQGGFTQSVAGTSCSAPTMAGVISLLNDIRLGAGKSPLGFLNPFIYQNPSGWTDITSGNNPGCNTNGFYAAQGWDPVTGFGSPNFTTLSALVKNLP